MERDDNRWLDEYLDHNLAQYGRADPRPGLENRILATLRAEEARVVPPQRWKWMLLAACSAVAILVFVAVRFNERRSQPPVISIQPSIPPPVVAHIGKQGVPRLEANPAHIRSSKLTQHIKARTEPATGSAIANNSHFPSSRELTEQQKLLLAYVEHTPRDEILAVAAREKDHSDLTIENLGIQRLEEPPLSK